MSANQGKVLKGLIDGKAAASHTHDYLPLSGGTMTGALNFKNSTWNLVGDDVYIGDHDVAGSFGIKGANGQTNIGFVNQGNNYYLKLASPGVTANRTITMPDSDGTMALTDDIPTSLPANGGTADYLNYTPLAGDGAGYAQFYQASSSYNPTNDWYTIIRMNHANSSGYFTELATHFHSDAIYFRRKAAGTVYGWKRLAFSDDIPSCTQSNIVS